MPTQYSIRPGESSSRRAARTAEEIRRGTIRALVESGEYGIRFMVSGRLVPVDRGTLQGSIRGELDAGALTYEISTPQKYAVVAEEGRAVGARRPPRARIEAWIKRKWYRGTPGQTTAQAAFLAVRAITRAGITGKFFFRTTADDLRRVVPEIFRRAHGR